MVTSVPAISIHVTNLFEVDSYRNHHRKNSETDLDSYGNKRLELRTEFDEITESCSLSSVNSSIRTPNFLCPISLKNGEKYGSYPRFQTVTKTPQLYPTREESQSSNHCDIGGKSRHYDSVHKVIGEGDERSDISSTYGLRDKLDKSNDMKKTKRELFSIASTVTATTYNSTYASIKSENSDADFSSSALIFANQCLLNSYERRSKSNAVNRWQSSPYQLQVSTGMSSNVSCNRSSEFLNESKALSSTVSYEKFESTHSLENLEDDFSQSSIDDFSQTSHEEMLDILSQSSEEEKEIERKLMLVKTILYRQKCVESSKKIMKQYESLGENFDDSSRRSDLSSTSAEIPTPDTNIDETIEPKASSYLEIQPKKKVSFFSRINSFFVQYDKSISHILHHL